MFLYTLSPKIFLITALLEDSKDLDRVFIRLVLAFFQGGFNTSMVATCPVGHTSRLSRTEAIACVLRRICAQHFSEMRLASRFSTSNMDGGELFFAFAKFASSHLIKSLCSMFRRLGRSAVSHKSGNCPGHTHKRFGLGLLLVLI